MAELKFDPRSGVVVPTTQEVRDDIASGLQEAFKTKDGDPLLNVDPSSPMGQVADIITTEAAAKNSEVAFLANQLNPRTATGIWLDALAALYGLTRHVSEPTVVVCTCTGLRGAVIPYGAIVQDTQGHQLRHSVGGGVTIPDSGSVETTFSAVEHGAIEIGPGTVTQIVTVIAGWDSVTNAAAGVTGRVAEPDGELLNRMIESYAVNANGTVANVQANLSELDGVLDCVVLENYTNQPQQQYGITLTAHSIAVCIVGGDDEAIAETIFQRKSAGCGTVGTTQVNYVDTEHFNASYTYNIVRPTAVALKIQVTFFADSMDAETQSKVKKALISDFLGELSNPRVKLATTVYASRFYRCIQSVTDSPINQILLGLNNRGLATSIDVPADESPTLSEETISLVFGGRHG